MIIILELTVYEDVIINKYTVFMIIINKHCGRIKAMPGKHQFSTQISHAIHLRAEQVNECKFVLI